MRGTQSKTLGKRQREKEKENREREAFGVSVAKTVTTLSTPLLGSRSIISKSLMIQVNVCPTTFKI